MTDEYLWDRSGEPDPEVTHLEQTLERLRWSGKHRSFERAKPARPRFGRKPWFMAAAAALVLGLASAFAVHRMHTLHPLTSWQLSSAGHSLSSVRAGQLIETGPTGASIESAYVGKVDLDPDTRLRLISTREDRHRLALEHGTIHALIWAPPTRFVVDTAAAKTVDLGCQYTLSVARNGQGFLTVELGWVAFQWNKVESFIPEGAACATQVGRGPDTPYFLDAPKALTKSLAEFDSTHNRQALTSVLQAARPRDALTLWHLLQRTRGEEQVEVFNRFAGLVALPPTVNRDGILRGDSKTMDAAWDALQLGDTSWWREWKRDW